MLHKFWLRIVGISFSASSLRLLSLLSSKCLRRCKRTWHSVHRPRRLARSTRYRGEPIRKIQVSRLKFVLDDVGTRGHNKTQSFFLSRIPPGVAHVGPAPESRR